MDDAEVHEKEILKVYLRIKPIEEKRLLELSEWTWNLHENCFQVKKKEESRSYQFHTIFDENCGQRQVFEEAVENSLRNVLNGKNSTIMTYGVSGSGKTYTMQGTRTQPGIMPRALEYLFNNIVVPGEVTVMPIDGRMLSPIDPVKVTNLLEDMEKLINNLTVDFNSNMKVFFDQRLSVKHEGQSLSNKIAERQITDKCRQLSVWISFVEIYNEDIYDLLVPPPPQGIPRAKMRLGRSVTGEAYVRGVKYHLVTDQVQAYALLIYGRQNSQFGLTNISRTHCIYTITLIDIDENYKPRMSRFNLCDLAGTERQNKTVNTGCRINESKHINSSLYVLGTVIEGIGNNQKHLHYRESKLTHLFQSALLGNEEVSLIVTLNPIPMEESISVLNVAAITRKVTINSVEESSRSSDTLDEELKLENKKLKEELRRIKHQNEEDQNYQRVKMNELRDVMQQASQMSIDREESVRQATITRYETKLQNIKSSYEAKLEDLRNSYKTDEDEVYAENTDNEDGSVIKLNKSNEKAATNTELIDQVAALKDTVQNKTIEIDKLTNQLKLCEGEIKGLLSKVKLFQTEIENHKQFSEKWSEEIKSSEKAQKSLLSSKIELTDRVIHLTEMLKEKHFSLARAEEQCDEVKFELLETKQDLEKVKMRRDQQFKKYDSIIDKLNERLQMQEREVKTYQDMFLSGKLTPVRTPYQRCACMKNTPSSVKSINHIRRSISDSSLNKEASLKNATLSTQVGSLTDLTSSTKSTRPQRACRNKKQ